MSSSSNRLAIVTEAVKLAGRGAEMHAFAKGLLNRMLRSWALEYKYPSLRRVGSPITLGSGTSTVALMSDYGAGMENLILGDDGLAIDEKSLDEFTELGGFKSSTARPSFYMVDRDAGVIRFNCSADMSYTVKPIYYRVPEDIEDTGAGDLETVWFDDDETVVQGLVQKLYQFLGDVREAAQMNLVESKKAQFRRGSVPSGGGTSRIALSRERFRYRR